MYSAIKVYISTVQCALKIGSVLVKWWDRKAEHSCAHGGCYTVFLSSDATATIVLLQVLVGLLHEGG